MRDRLIFIGQFVFTIGVAAFLVVPAILSISAGVTVNYFRGISSGVTLQWVAQVWNLYYDTILHKKSVLEFLVKEAGADRVLLGSDYPFDMGNLDCVARVRVAALDPAARDLILGGYAQTLFDEGADA